MNDCRDTIFSKRQLLLSYIFREMLIQLYAHFVVCAQVSARDQQLLVFFLKSPGAGSGSKRVFSLWVETALPRWVPSA